MPYEPPSQMTILVGKADGKPVIMLQVDEQQYTLTMHEAQQLGAAILISCGIAQERK